MRSASPSSETVAAAAAGISDVAATAARMACSGNVANGRQISRRYAPLFATATPSSTCLASCFDILLKIGQLDLGTSAEEPMTFAEAAFTDRPGCCDGASPPLLHVPRPPEFRSGIFSCIFSCVLDRRLRVLALCRRKLGQSCSRLRPEPLRLPKRSWGVLRRGARGRDSTLQRYIDLPRCVHLRRCIQGAYLRSVAASHRRQYRCKCDLAFCEGVSGGAGADNFQLVLVSVALRRAKPSEQIELLKASWISAWTLRAPRAQVRARPSR